MTTTELYAGASPDAIRHHYDVGNEFFQLWLDKTMTYSCALWSDASNRGDTDSLESAQTRKLDYLIEGARAAGAQRVLDVGCGWGSLLRRLVKHHAVGHVTGLTLSPLQADLITARGDQRVNVRVESWTEHQPKGQYDAILSIGAFEHFARFGLPRRRRVAAYRKFFARCRELLPPGGRLALQTNAKGGNVRIDRETATELRFVADRIFPESELPWCSEILEASERLFEVVDLRNDPEDYARTCAVWRANLEANHDAAVELVGPLLVEDYLKYLDVTVEHFRRRHLALLRLIYERVY
jgi:cyclopropane-fatty-acyl-phospholipid synthase